MKGPKDVLNKEQTVEEQSRTERTAYSEVFLPSSITESVSLNNSYFIKILTLKGENST